MRLLVSILSWTSSRFKVLIREDAVQDARHRGNVSSYERVDKAYE